MSSRIHINNCNIEGSQVGEKNIMNFTNPITEKDWNDLEMFLNGKLETLQEGTLYHFLTKEAKGYVNERNQKGLKEFVHRHIAEFTTGVFCNVASTAVINILRNFGIQI